MAGMSGVESGKAAPLVDGPPGVELHTVVEELPSGAVGEIFPVVLTAIGVAMVPNTPAGGNVGAVVVVPTIDVESVLVIVTGADAGTTGAMEGAGSGGTPGGGGAETVDPGRSDMNDVAGNDDSGTAGAVVVSAASVDALAGVAPVVAPTMGDTGVTCTIGVPGVICPAGVAQVTTVPGIVGSEASGTGANVVSGVPGWVIAENGLGPLSGEVTIAPGIDESPIAVVPMVETCARQTWAPDNRATVVISKRRIAIPSCARL